MKCVACDSEITINIAKINGFEVFKCKDCGLIYTHPLPEDEVLNRFYQGFLFEKPERSQIQNAIPKKQKELSELFGIKISELAGKSFLDFGGGTGLSWIAAKEAGMNAYYYDIDEQAKQFVITEFGLDNSQIIENIQNCEMKFDFILSDNVIEHVKNPLEFIDTLYGLLSPGGVLIIKTPRASNTESLFVYAIWGMVYLKKAIYGNGILKALKATFVHRYWHCEPPRHLYGFTDSSFRSLVTKTTASEAEMRITSYLLNPVKNSFAWVLSHIPNKFLMCLAMLFFLPVIIAEIPVIIVRYILISLKLISLAGMTVKIVKPLI